jgi:hypothetical protein
MFNKQYDKYINLKMNGRLFPSWIMKNFSAYQLPEIVQSDDDPCFKKTKMELRKYQIFLGKLLNFTSPYKNLLVMHGLGSGKTTTFINIYNILYSYVRGWNVFVLIKATLKDDPWLKDLERWLQEDDKKDRMANIIFISYDSPIADKTFMDAIKNSDTSKKSLYVIDEAHNFIRNVYSNISSKQGRRAQTIYDYMIQDGKENEHTRIILLSGTPAINTPYELALLFNLLRPNTFPKSESVFNQKFISEGTYKILNPIKKNQFQRRIIGLVSHYVGSTPDYFASKTIEYVDVEMSEYQEEIYSYFEDIEKKIASKKRKSGGSSETYKSYTRQSCNFVFPALAQGISGETRPRPNKYKVSEVEASNVEKGKDIDKKSNTYYNVTQYLGALDNFISLFKKSLDKLMDSKPTLQDNIDEFYNKYKGDYTEFRKHAKKSELYTEMHKCSAKMMQMIFTIIKSPGPVLVYSNYVLMEGLQIFKLYLNYFGFNEMTDDNNKIKSLKYTEYHGGLSKEIRKKNLTTYNNFDNKIGEICKIIMVSPAGAEGLNLLNTREVHLMEPYWHEVRMTQMIGRAIRMCSHKDLPKEDRNVKVYRYKSIRSGNKSKWTTDEYIEDLSRSKEGLIQSFIDAMKEVAVDCVLNKNHNSMVQDIKCFQFNEPSLFDEQIGPAYVENLLDDEKLDNGSNSLNSTNLRIRVSKIQAVKQLTGSDSDKIIYSKPEYYWYNPDTHVVYDYDYHYAIGKVGTDDDELPKKINKDTYIIDKLIPIPLINDNPKRSN